MFPLFLSAFSSVFIAALIKYFEGQRRERLMLLAGNYLMAALISLVIWLLERPEEGVHLSLSAALLGAVNGLLFLGGFTLFMQTVALQGMAVTVSLMRLSIAIPVLVSIVLFGERPTWVQLFAIGLSAVAVLLLAGIAGESQERRLSDGPLAWFAPLGLFFCVGISDAILKVFERLNPTEDKGLFLGTIFIVAFGLSVVALWAARVRPRTTDFLAGLALGIPNQFSSLFLVIALQTVPGAIAFPVTNVSIMALSCLVGVFLWHEKLGRRGWLGVSLALVSVWLMVG